MSGHVRPAPLIDLGRLPTDIQPVRRGGLNPAQVAAAIAAKDHEIQRLQRELVVALEQASTNARALTEWQSWHRTHCMGAPKPRSVPRRIPDPGGAR